MKTIHTNQMKDMILFIADTVIDSKPLLTEVDSKIGDGDHGIGMATGFSAVKNALSEKQFESINQLYRETGMAMLNSMGGASGVIFSSLFLGGVKGMETVTSITPSDFANMMKKSLEAIERRGGAQPGDKTMIDALDPACAAMEAYIGDSFEEMLSAAAAAAKQGVENSKQYIAKFGRAKSLMERAIGFQDAGATSVWIILEAAYTYINPDRDNLRM